MEAMEGRQEIRKLEKNENGLVLFILSFLGHKIFGHSIRIIAQEYWPVYNYGKLRLLQ